MSDDGKSNSLRLSEEGEDGLEELVTCFGSSKIQYGLATIDVQDGKGKKVWSHGPISGENPRQKEHSYFVPGIVDNLAA